MATTGLFTVRAFARFARTTRDILHHYDKIGLLSPTIRGKNRYRYYSSGQLAVINLIRTLQELGMTLAEIKQLQERRTPELMDAVFSQQMEKIDKKIAEWIRIKKLLATFQKLIHTSKKVDEQVITVRQMPAESIVMGGRNDYSNGQTDYDALFHFYRDISTKYPEADLNYPVWAVFPKERIERRDWNLPECYYFYNPEGFDRRPAGLYAVGHMRGGYGRCRDLYQRLVAYIDAHHLEICGDAYEEYPLNEVCVADASHYLIRVMIQVRPKKTAPADKTI